MSFITKSKGLKQTAQISIDAVIAAVALMLAFVLRFDGEIPGYYLDRLPAFLLGITAGKIVVSYSLGSYRQMWKYTSLRELWTLLLSATAAAVLMVVLRAVGLLWISYSVIVIDAVLFLLGVSGVRVLRRLQWAFRGKVRDAAPQRADEAQQRPKKRTLLIGAGDTAHALIDDIRRVNYSQWDLVGLLDDDPVKQGMRLRGIPVLGPTTQLEETIQSHKVQHVVVAMPSAEKEVIRNIISRIQEHHLTMQVVPSIAELVQEGHTGNGKVRPQAAVTLADLVDSAEVKRTLLPVFERQERDRTVLVTGGAGYIGSWLVRKLLKEGYNVHVLDNFTFGDGGLSAVKEHPLLQIIEGDISSIRDVVGAVKDVGTVVALAAIVGDPACGVSAEETLNLNYESTKVLVEACNFYGVSRLVFASSCSVYGASNNTVLTERSPLTPVSLYARTRILSENVIFERRGDVVPVILRLATVYGLSPRMRFDLVVNTLTVRGVVDGKFQVFGGDQWRPFVHCRDAAEAFMQAATVPTELVDGEIFNVGSSNMNYTISQVADIVAQEVPGVEVQHVDAIDDPRNYRVSFDKIRNRLGFTPSTDLRSGILEMAEAIKVDPRLQNYGDPIFSNVQIMRGRLGDARNADRERLRKVAAPSRSVRTA